MSAKSQLKLAVTGAVAAVVKHVETNVTRTLGGGGAKFFSASAKRGEALELQTELNSGDREREKNALKRIIANMTLGRDVSQLFVDVVKLGQTPNLPVKKLVYLYVLSNAKLQPEKALLAVNTFLQDSSNESPIVRALALRSMMCLRVDSVLEYTLEPLRRCLADSHEYVRKTASIALGKLFHQNHKLFVQQGFLESLYELMSDTSPSVISNVVLILSEIAASGFVAIQIQSNWIQKMLQVLPECTEWGQIYMLEPLTLYHAKEDELDVLLERVKSRTQHANPALVLSAVKCVATWLHKRNKNDELHLQYVQRITNALKSLISSASSSTEAATHYVVCKNIWLLLNLFPTLLSDEIRCFFIRATDFTFVKIEKLRLMIRLISPATSPSVVQELKEYAYEIDPLFISHVIDATARAAIKVESIAHSCCDILLDIVGQRPEFLPQIVCAAKDIVRKYPNIFLDIATPLIQVHDAANVTDDEAKVALVWMLGEFCDIIENGSELLRSMLVEFLMQDITVQLALLSAVIKLFLRNPSMMEQTLRHVLKMATEQTAHPDLRDRAFVYFRLLHKGIGAEKMKLIVHGRQPPVNTNDVSEADSMPFAEQLKSLTTASAVYGIHPRAFVPKYGLPRAEEEEEEDDDGIVEGEVVEEGCPIPVVVEPTKPQHSLGFLDDPALQAMSKPAVSAPVLVRRNETNNAYEVSGTFANSSKGMLLKLTLVNCGTMPLKGFKLQCNKNAFNFVPVEQVLQSNGPIQPSASHSFDIPMKVEPHWHSTERGLKVEVGLRVESHSPTPVRFSVTPATDLMFRPNAAAMDSEAYMKAWQGMDNDGSCEQKFKLPHAQISEQDLITAFKKHHWVVVRHSPNVGIWGCAITYSGDVAQPLLFQRKSNPDPSTVIVRSRQGASVWPLVDAVVKQCLTSGGASRSGELDGIFATTETTSPMPAQLNPAHVAPPTQPKQPRNVLDDLF